MNRKSIIKILFAGLFLLIATMSLSQFSPENEIKTIQTLPKKPHATLDIEVTKIKSQPIVGNLDKENKNIIIDFSTIKDTKENKMIIDESNYALFATNSLDNLPSYSSNKARVKSETTPKYTFEKVADKVIKVNFEEQPDRLYVGVLNKNTNSVDKIFNVTLNQATTLAAATFDNASGRILLLNNPIYIIGSTDTGVNKGAYLFNNSNEFSPYGTSNIYTAIFAGAKVRNSSPTYNGISYGTNNPPSSYGLSPEWPTSGQNAFVRFQIYSYSSLNADEVTKYTASNVTASYFAKYPIDSFQNIYLKNAPSGVIGSDFSNQSVSGYDSSSTNSKTKFVNIGGQTGSVGFAFYNWNLTQHSVAVLFNNGSLYDAVRYQVPPFEPEAYYDNTNSTIKLDNLTTNINMSSFWNYNNTGGTVSYAHPSPGHIGANVQLPTLISTYSTPIEIGTIKILDGIDNIASDIYKPTYPLKFYTGGNITLTGTTGTVQGNIYIDTPSTLTANARDTLTSKKVYFKIEGGTPTPGVYTVTGKTAPSSPTDNSGINLLRLGITNPSNIIYDNIINSINLIIGQEISTSFTLKNPLPQIANIGNTNAGGMYYLTQGTANSTISPISSSNPLITNTNTLQWGSSGPLNTNYGITLYNFSHNLVIDLMDSTGSNILATQTLLTNSTGKMTSSANLSSGSGTSFIFGQINPNITVGAAIALNNWSLKNESYILRVSHYPIEAVPSNSPFAVDKFNITIEGFNPLVYYDNNTATSNTEYIAIGSTITKSIDNATNQNILIGNVLLNPNDRRITITPSNPDGITYYLGDSGTGTITFTNTSDSTDKITGVLSLSGTTANDMTGIGRTLSLNIDGTTLKAGQTYAADKPLQIGVTKNGTAYYGTILSKLTIQPSYILKESAFNISNPVPQASADGTGVYPLNNSDGNPIDVPTNNGTLIWNPAPLSTDYGISLYNRVHNIGVWITSGSTTIKTSFTTDVTGKISTSKLMDTINGVKFLVGDFNGAFGIGINQWDTFSKNGIKIAIHHFEAGIDPMTATLAQAFASDIFTVGIDDLDPSVYFDNTNSSIKLNDDFGKDLIAPSQDVIDLGYIQLNNSQKTITENPNSGLKFLGNNLITLNSTDGTSTINSEILIDGKSLKDQKLVNELSTKSRKISLRPFQDLEAGKIYKASAIDKQILVLGVEGRGTSDIPNDSISPSGIYSEIINSITLATTPIDALVIEILNDSGQWERVKQGVIFDHGSVIKGQDIAEPTLYKNFRVRRWNSTPLNTINFDLTIPNKDNPLILDSDPSQTIEHKFIPTIDNATPTDKTRSFKISSEIQNSKVPSTLPAGVYQKTSDVIINITP